MLSTHRRSVGYAVLLVVALTLVNVTYFNFWPTYLQTVLGYSSTTALAASLISIAGAMLGMPAWGYVADRFGWSRMLLWAGLSTAVTTVLLLVVLPVLPPGSGLAVWIQLPAALSAGGIAASAPGLVSAIFPTEVRQTGFSLPYNLVVAVLGGFLNLILVWLVASVGLGASMYVVLVACGLTIVAAFVVLRVRIYLGRGARPADGFSKAGDPAATGRPGLEADVRLLAPLRRPPSVWDGLCFLDHLRGCYRALGRDDQLAEVWSHSPAFYFANADAIVGPYDDVPISPGSTMFEFELELGAVIGRGGRDLHPHRAEEHIAGFTLYNDWTARDHQLVDMAQGIGMAKSKDSAITLGLRWSPSTSSNRTAGTGVWCSSCPRRSTARS